MKTYVLSYILLFVSKFNVFQVHFSYCNKLQPWTRYVTHIKRVEKGTWELHNELNKKILTVANINIIPHILIYNIILIILYISCLLIFYL